MKPSSQPVGLLWGCRTCKSKTFGSTESIKHSVETGHETFLIFGVEPKESA